MKITVKSRTCAVAALCLGAAFGCSATSVRVDRDQRTVVARTVDGRVSYHFGPVPVSWDAIHIEGNDAAWMDHANDGVAHVDHSCARDQDTPLTALVQQLLIGFTEREFVLEETVPFDGREARHVVVRAKLDGVLTQLELYVMKKDGCVYDLGYTAAPDRFALGQEGFRTFATGFATTHTPAPDAPLHTETP